MHLFSVTDIMFNTKVSFKNKFQSRWKKNASGMVFFTHFTDSFHGNLTRQFSKTYELFDDRSVKTVWRLCLNFERTFQTSSSEKFCAASFKLPLKTRTWKVKEKKNNLTLNCIRITRNTAATNKVSHNNFFTWSQLSTWKWGVIPWGKWVVV